MPCQLCVVYITSVRIGVLCTTRALDHAVLCLNHQKLKLASRLSLPQPALRCQHCWISFSRWFTYPITVFICLHEFLFGLPNSSEGELWKPFRNLLSTGKKRKDKQEITVQHCCLPTIAKIFYFSEVTPLARKKTKSSMPTRPSYIIQYVTFRPSEA